MSIFCDCQHLYFLLPSLWRIKLYAFYVITNNC